MKNNKTIGVTLRFFTNDLPERIGGGDDAIPCWDRGAIYLESNNDKGIKSNQGLMFNSLAEIPQTINRVLKRAKIYPINTFHGVKING